MDVSSSTTSVPRICFNRAEGLVRVSPLSLCHSYAKLS